MTHLELGLLLMTPLAWIALSGVLWVNMGGTYKYEKPAMIVSIILISALWGLFFIFFR